MKMKSRILTLFAVALIGTLGFSACSDDDNGTNPPVNGQAIKMTLTKGDYFDYNRWELDDNNQKVGNPEVYRVTYLDNNNVQLDGFDKFVYLKVENRTAGVKLSDDVAIRTDASGDLYMYNFQHDMYTAFFEFVKMLDPNVNVTVPYQQWDLVADFNDANGNANTNGHTWVITAENMQPFNFNVQIPGIPQPLAVSVLPEVTGAYDGVLPTKMNIKGKDVTMWQVRLFITMKLRSSLVDQDITLNQTMTFSDDPDGQITMIQETAKLVLFSQTYSLPGEQRELTTYVKF